MCPHGDPVLSRGDIISDKARRILKAILESDAGQSAAIFRINIRVSENKLWISTPLHSTLLHRRGWRQENVRTPLRENWAAALLTVAGWEPNEPLVDPFCGSGTILIEAGRKAAGLPAHVEAPFGWSPWYENSHSPFQSSTQQRSAIFGSDKHELSQKAHINATSAQADVHLRVADIRQLTPPPTAPGLVLTGHSIAMRFIQEKIPLCVPLIWPAVAAWLVVGGCCFWRNQETKQRPSHRKRNSSPIFQMAEFELECGLSMR